MHTGIKLNLPTGKDWDRLEKCYAGIRSTHKHSFKAWDEIGINFNSPVIKQEGANRDALLLGKMNDDYFQTSRLMIYLARYFQNKCPLPVLSILENSNDGFFLKEFLDEQYELDSPVLAPPFGESLSRGPLIRLLDKLEKSSFINKITYKAWLEEYGQEQVINKDLEKYIKRKSSCVFPLTGIGTIAYEYLINTPEMYMSYFSAYFEESLLKNGKVHNLTRSQNKYNTSLYSLINLSIASRLKRLVLFKDSPFSHDKESPKYNTYHESIFKEQKNILGDNYDFFIHMHNPATKILREIKALEEVEVFFNLRSNKIDMKGYVSFDDLRNRLFKIKVENDKNLLLKIWTDHLNLSLSSYKGAMPRNPI